MSENELIFFNEKEYDHETADSFCDAMKQKLDFSRARGRGGWYDKGKCPEGYLQKLLHEHIEKGDPIDVANLCMMIWSRGEETDQKEGGDYDLATMHIVHGPDDTKRVRLTEKAQSGEIGHKVVFEFSDSEDLEDFIRQLEAIKNEAFGD